VPVPIAVLGGEVDVVTPEVEDAALEDAAGHAERQRFRLARPRLADVGKPDERGDLYANVDVRFRRRLDEDASITSAEERQQSRELIAVA
jgi:DnaJ-class molecular chaperone